MSTGLSLDLLLWRRSLRSAPALPDAADLLDWSVRLRRVGADRPADLLAKAAHLRLGFSEQATALCRSADGVMAGRGGAPGESAVDRAAAELRMLARLHRPKLDSLTVDSLAAAVLPPDDLGAATDALHAAVHGGRAEDEAAVAYHLAGWRRLAADTSGFDYRAFSASPLPLLTAAILRVTLAHYASGHADLAEAPLGSIPFFLRVAALDGRGLGPYFSNVGSLARGSGDVFGLARIAADASGRPDEVMAWALLLVQGCPNVLLREFIDEVGDACDGRALDNLLRRLTARSARPVDTDLVMRIRDAALDNGDYGLAERAQAALVREHPEIGFDQIILGSIQASGGRFDEAEATFANRLRSDPDDDEARERWQAAKARDFAPFALTRGLGSAVDLQHHRLRCRQTEPAAASAS